MKSILIFVTVLLIGIPSLAKASLLGVIRDCSVSAEVVNIGSETTRSLNTEEKYDYRFIELRILSTKIYKNQDCPVRKGDTYRSADNNPGSFSLGQRLRADITHDDAMGANGVVVGFLSWHNPKGQDGEPISEKRYGQPITYFQSSDEPLKTVSSTAASSETSTSTIKQTRRGFWSNLWNWLTR